MKNKNKRILRLEKEVLYLKATLSGFMEFVGYDGKKYVPLNKFDIEPIEIFQNKLRENELQSKAGICE